MTMTTRPRMFIGSSAEHLDLAHAIQSNLDYDVAATVWAQGIFKPSSYPLPDLLTALRSSEFAVFVFAPDDVVTKRTTTLAVTRDNVLFEAGLAVGILGLNHVFIVAPRDVNMAWASDLEGVNYLTYDPRGHAEDAHQAILGAVSTEIRMAVRSQLREDRIEPGVLRVGFFEDFLELFPTLINNTQTLTLQFIHSRRWRENYQRSIRQMLARDGTSIEVILPDQRESYLLDHFRVHFDDGPRIPALITDCYHFFRALKREFPGRITVRSSPLYPNYSFYMFDEEVILATYPNSPERRGSPTIHARSNGEVWEFIQRDLRSLRRLAPALDDEALEEQATWFS